MLVSLSEACDHLRIDDVADDGWLNVMIPAVSQAVLLWLKDDWRAYELEYDDAGEVVLSDGKPVMRLDEGGQPIVKPVVKAAVLVELAAQFRFREGDAPQVPAHWGHGYTLGIGATALLTPLRRATRSEEHTSELQ